MKLVVVTIPDADFPVLINLDHIVSLGVNPQNGLAGLVIIGENSALETSMTLEALVTAMERPHTSWHSLAPHFITPTNLEV